MKIRINLLIFAVVICFGYNLNATTITVTSAKNDGEGTLREAIAMAKSGDTIIFADDITSITIERTASSYSGTIVIDKNLTIDGGTGNKVSIIGANSETGTRIIRLFKIDTPEINFELVNLQFSRMIDVVNITEQSDCSFGATNCNFVSCGSGVGGMQTNDPSLITAGPDNTIKLTDCFFENSNWLKGIVYADSNSIATITITNCSFYSISSNTGSVANVHSSGSIIKLINCAFISNVGSNSGGVVYAPNSTLISVNSTFFNNSANSAYNANTTYGGAIYCNNAYLYHCTFVGNQVRTIGHGGAVYSNSTLHSYNCIYIGNLEATLTPTPAGQLRAGTVVGNNLIHYDTIVTKKTIFGDKEIEIVDDDGNYLCYIMPMPSPGTRVILQTTKLTASDIQVPNGITAAEVINLLVKDQAGAVRAHPISVAFGTVEFEGVSIKEKTITELSISPNPASSIINLSFEVVCSDVLRISLGNLLGQELLELYNGYTDAGAFIKEFSLESLPVGVYCLKIQHNENVEVVKIIKN